MGGGRQFGEILKKQRARKGLSKKSGTGRNGIVKTTPKTTPKMTVKASVKNKIRPAAKKKTHANKKKTQPITRKSASRGQIQSNTSAQLVDLSGPQKKATSTKKQIENDLKKNGRVRQILARSSPENIDAAGMKTVEEFGIRPVSQITTGTIQSSFHKAERENNAETYTGRFPIVGIGSSAGGIETLSELLATVDCETGMGFVIIQHLAPNHETLLPAILARVTKMPIHLGKTDMQIEPNTIYILPPNTNMGVVSGKLEVLPRIENPGRHMPIDFFFRCLADDQQHLAIGVILSGADGDGAQGLRAINAQGGITIVQEPSSALVDGMPKSAIMAGAIMAGAIVKFYRSKRSGPSYCG